MRELCVVLLAMAMAIEAPSCIYRQTCAEEGRRRKVLKEAQGTF
jgi:hypothetical protein